MWLKTGKIQIVFGGFILSLLFVFSCSEEKRHEMLTFFFDGVPPLGGEPEVESLIESSEPNRVSDPNRLPQIVWYVHEPQRDCVQCHGERNRQGFSGQVQLVAQVPELCYQCHPDLMDLKGWVHGPVAVGVCTFCHDPHKSKNPYMLVQSIPDLCYRCHEAEVIAYIDSNHTGESYSNCMECHLGHASEEPALLKKDWQGVVPQ